MRPQKLRAGCVIPKSRSLLWKGARARAAGSAAKANRLGACKWETGLGQCSIPLVAATPPGSGSDRGSESVPGIPARSAIKAAP
jgi:hypothetical protein